MVAARGQFVVLGRYALALLFVGAGGLHFIAPQPYLRMMPPALPAPGLLVQVSGALEIGLGLLLLLRRTRRLASWGLVALLVAVFPANVYMALIHQQLHVPGWLAWGRLPVQLPLIWWAWKVGREP